MKSYILEVDITHASKIIEDESFNNALEKFLGNKFLLASLEACYWNKHRDLIGLDIKLIPAYIDVFNDIENTSRALLSLFYNLRARIAGAGEVFGHGTCEITHLNCEDGTVDLLVCLRVTGNRSRNK